MKTWRLATAIAVLFSGSALAVDVDSPIGLIWLDPNGTVFFQRANGASWCSGAYGTFVRVSVGRSNVTSQDTVRNILSTLTAAKLAGKTIRVVNVRENTSAGHCDFDAILML